jgi:hypothetical protein
VCEAVCLLRDFLLLSSFLSSKKVISGRQEAYFGNSECSPTGCVPVVSPHLTPEELTQREIARVALTKESTQKVPTRATMTKGLAQQVPTQAKSGVVPIRNVPAEVEVVVADALPHAEGIHANEAEPRSEDVMIGADALVPGSLGIAMGLGGARPWSEPVRV